MWSLLLLALCSSLQEGMRPSHCQSLCNENENFVNNINPCNTCDNRKECSLTADGGPGCDCSTGFFRNNDGKCVSEDECEEKTIKKKICRKDEVFLECSCEKTCCNGGSSEGCAASCKKGCFCKDGLVRNKKGKCIRLEECENDNTGPGLPSPSHCGPKEQFYECMPLCEGTCSALLTNSHLFCKMACRKGCFCAKGLYQTHDKRCVPASQCTAPNSPTKGPPPMHCSTPKCGKDCYLDYSTNRCPSCKCPGTPPVSCSMPKCDKDCVVDYSTKPCPSCSCSGTLPVYCSIPNCDEGCSVDYSTEPCPSCSCPSTPPVYCSIPNCDEGCSVDYSTDPCPSCSCPSTPPVSCSIPNCDEGCSLDYSSTPCPSCKCPNSCGIDEVYRECGSACPNTCANLGKSMMCTMQCVPGCFCSNGLVRNDQGKCVSPEDCPQNMMSPTKKPSDMCKDNEEFQDCGTACPPTCKTIGKTLPCTYQCVSGCFCKKGMVRNDEGKCVNINECPKKTCGANEEWLDCGSACPPTCSKLKSNDYACIALCVPGCFCKRGLIRNDQGVCIEPKDCRQSQKICPINEEYTQCASACNSCAVRGRCEIACSPGCDCMKGYYRDSEKNCIPKEQCPRIDRPRPHGKCRHDQKFYNCVPRCSRTCEAYKRTPKTYCKQVCQKGCFCKEGLYETKDGNCVPPSQCPAVPPKKKCPKNEVYSNCTIPCNDCQTRGKCNFLVCNKGCDCRRGYYRGFGGQCIPAHQCPVIDPTPAPNVCLSPDEQFYDCIPRCMRTCKAVTRPVKIYCSQLCVSGCFCREGLVEAEDGSCVAPEQCPIPTTSPQELCPVNEEYSYCANPCNDCETKGKCNFLVCNKGCDCKKGYHRNSNGICILALQCPSTTPTPSTIECDDDDEEYYDCIPGCQQTCFALTSEVKIACKMPCRSGCYCRKGLYQKDDGTCVPPEECYETPPTSNLPTATPTPSCPKNEEYYNCIPTCKNTCENYKAVRPFCPLICIKGCSCKKGLVRRKDGKCVKPEKCNQSSPTTKPTTSPTPSCAKNEKYYECIPTCKNTCENYQAIKPLCPRICIKGCSCKEGLVRRSDGKCVKPEKCNKSPSTKKPTSPPSNISPICLLDKKIGPCRAGKPRYFYNYRTGQCEKFKYGGCRGNKNNFKTKGECQVICGENNPPVQCSIPKCGTGCTIDYSTKPCPSCSCPNNPPVQCSMPKCGTECAIDYSTKPCPSCSCPSVPPPQNSVCMQPKDSGPCMAYFSRFFYNQKTSQCEEFVFGGCKGNKNNFKTKEECEITCNTGSTSSPQKCGKDEEYYGCVPNCHNTCDTYNKKGPCPLFCKSGCFCKRGMVKNKDDKCVKTSECPSLNTPPTEKPPPSNPICQLAKEVGPCRARIPRFFFNHETHQCESFNYGGCRGNQNNFKTKEECETSCGSEKPPPSNTICQQAKEVGPCRARIPRFFFNHETHQCESFEYGGCKGNQNNFKTKEECETSCGSGTSNSTCKSDEQYYECVPNCHNTCSTYNKTDIACPDSCGPGCFCKEGLVKNDDGKCVSPSQCNAVQPPGSEKCGDGEEYYDYCAPSCGGTCRAYNNPGIYHCPRCLPGCWCKKGFYKNSDGLCVPPDQCKDTGSTNTCGDNEEYRDCGSACPSTCSNLGKNQICTQQCMKGCFCKEGFVRNDQGVCVEPEECPEQGSGECGDDEEYYDDCAPSCTGTCRAYNNPGIYNCPRCWPGCWCREGLYKNSNGTCVTPDQCNETTPPNQHQCGEDEEYYKDCAPSCGGTCETYKKRDILNCRLCRPGCWCKKGLVKRKDGKCVPENKCEASTDTCDDDEEYRDCGSACPPTCSNLGKNQICTQQCVPGCFCGEGLVRNNEGDCVEPEECPEQECSEDEEYRSCGSSCPPTCSSRGKYQVCTKECVPGCFCKNGLVRNDEGECVEPEYCPTEPNNPTDTCSTDEEYQECGSSCPDTCSNLGMDRICTKECVPGCFCKKGLVKNDQDECVEPKECPQKTCGEDEEYNDCGSACPLTCSNMGKDQVCTDQCVQGCFCKEGLVRNENNECVNPEECPQKSPEECGKNEKYYDECAPSCGGTCNTYNKTAVILCMPCSPGCWCKEGLVKNQEGECIPPDQCKVPKRPNTLCGVNEIYYDKCAPSCRGSCDTYNTTIECPRCMPGCWCKKGYLKNSNGKCVKMHKCNIKPKTCPLNQKYYDCMPDCQNRCNPPDVCAAVCKSGCFCKEGLVMNSRGMCVRKKLCKNQNNGKPDCGPDQEYYECYQKCRNSCATRNSTCPTMCESGCFCKKGMMFNKQGKCVKLSECEECSGANEEVVSCAKPKSCNNCLIRGNCKLKRCVEGCDCKSGYYRDNSGICIPEDQCPGDISRPPKESCSPPKCDDGCSIDHSTKPCPSCKCSDDSSGPPKVRCSIPKCKEGCRIDYSTKPCPSCKCSGPSNVRCSIPKCDDGCSINYSTKPCPSCSCTGKDDSGNTSSIDYENDSSEEYSYSEESVSSSQVSESSSMGHSQSAGQRSSRSHSGFGSWDSSNSSSNKNNSEKNSSKDSEVGYSTMSSSTSDRSSSMSSDYGKSSSKSSSGSKMWSSSTSSGSENVIDSSNDLSGTEDMSSSESESGYSTMSSDSESWSSNMSNSENISSEDDDEFSFTQDSDESSFSQYTDESSLSQDTDEFSLTQDTDESSLIQETDESSFDQETNESSLTQNSEWESGYSKSSPGSDDWSSVMTDDSENSSSKSESDYRIWSSKMTSDFEDDEEFQEGGGESFDETNYDDNGNEFEEYSISWIE